MYSILKKEVNSFFSSPIAYLVIGVFLLVNGLFLWVFKDNFNVLNAGFADLNSFFYLTPWLFLFLIPAITMKSFADELNSGTIEILKTKPVTDWQIVLAKFFASLLLVCVALIPTLTYVYTVYVLGNPVGNLDIGSTVGSYLGVFFLAATYTSIGLFTSTLSKNQIVAFILSIFITFILFYGFEYIESLNFFKDNFKLFLILFIFIFIIVSLFTPNITIFPTLSYLLRALITYVLHYIIKEYMDVSNHLLQQLGINEHFKSISRGVIDTRDVIYFCSVIVFFLFITKQQLKNE